MKKIMKYLSMMVMAAMLFLVSAFPVWAADASRLVDAADMLSDAEQTQIEEQLNSVSEELDFDVVIVTIESLGGKDVDWAADYVYDEYDYGMGSKKDGAILLISMYDREWSLTARGNGESYLPAEAREHIANAFLDDLSDGDYADAFEIYITETAELVQKAQNGEVYKEPYKGALCFGVSLVISLIVAAIVVGIMKSQLKSVRFRPEASDYYKSDSLKIKHSRERFLYRQVTRTQRSDNKGSGSMSSHGHSTSGKF